MEQNEMTEEMPRSDAPAAVVDRSTVYIGRKDAMTYVLAVVTQFNQGLKEVTLKARGMSISRLVDVSQIVKNRFIPTMRIGNIDITTEELTSEDGRQSKVSSMAMKLHKE